jgi:hypothetical protein
MLLLTLIILRPAPVTGQDDFPDVCAEDPGNLVRNCEFDDGLSHWHTFVEAGDPPDFSVEHSYPACDSPKCPALRIWAEDWYIGGIYQQVSGVVPGVTYWANVIWMVYDPAGQLDNTVGRRIGIDPTGGTDPTSPNVVWSQDVWKSFASCPYKICRELQVEAVSQNATITIFLRIEDTWKNRRDEFPLVPDRYFQEPESFWIDDPGMVRAVAVPTPTPTPTPTPAPISATISATGGGSLTSNDAARSTTIQVPAGAVTGSTVITYAYQMALPAGDLVGIDRFFHLEAAQDGTSITRFNRPVTIAVRYPVTNLLKGDTTHLYWLSGTNWITNGVTTTVRTTSSLTSTTDHFSLFAVLGETNWVHLPTIMKLTFEPDTP